MKKILFTFLPFLLFGFLTQPASALDFIPPPFNDLEYKGQYVGQSVPDPITLASDETKEVIIKIKNVGTKTWYNTGSNYVSAYTVDPNYRKSVFVDSSWIGSSQISKITETIKPGEVAEVKILLNAPDKTGEYIERFYLAAENRTWIKSTYFYLKIKVVPAIKTDVVNKEAVATAPVIEEVDNEDSDYVVKITKLTSRQIFAERGGDEINFEAVFKNLEKDLSGYELMLDSVDNDGDIYDSSWEDKQAVLQSSESIKTGASLKTEFSFRAPSKIGMYKITFYLKSNDEKVIDSALKIYVKVKANAPASYEPAGIADTKKITRELVDEPSIRVGLQKAETPVKFQSNYDYYIYAGDILKGKLSAKNIATISYLSERYHFRGAGIVFSSKGKIRLVPRDMNYWFTIPTYNRHVSWKGKANFNAYRGVMEYVYSPRKDVPYVVNELSLDTYIAGIGETSDASDIEYIKAILVAARSYAYYHINNGVSADKRTFDVYATTADQLYLGYNAEVIGPNIVSAQKSTFGEMVTYNSNPVVTPYYGNSDGVTRGWKSIWGGTDKAWLQPVVAKYDVGKKLFGHGVGMSARDASYRASLDGWGYERLLKHYYTGVDVEKIY